MATDILLRVLCLAATLVATWGSGDVGGIVDLQRSTGGIQTVLGCTETLVCEGPGESIDWVSKRQTLNSSTKTITIPGGGENLRSHITLANITPEDQASYSCHIRGAKTITMSTFVTVSNTIVHIEPIADINISDRAVGQTLSISCQVITCQERLTVSIIKGSQLVVSEKYSNKKNISLSADMIISADTADRYACRVLLETGTVFNEPFTVTGTPHGIPSINNRNPVQPEDLKNTNPTSTTKNSSTFTEPQVTIISALYLCAVALLYN